MRTRVGLFPIVFGAIWLTACATPSASSFKTAVPTTADRPYLVQPGDTLVLKFTYHPDYNQEAVVRPDGKFALPLIGELNAAGASPVSIAGDVARRYSTNLREPEVSVSVKPSEQRVYVGGEVEKPGFVVYRPGLTALQAMLEAGGPKLSAKIRDVVLFQREGGGEYRASKIDLAKPLEEGDTAGDVGLAPSDVLFVPKTRIAKLNAWVEQYFTRLLPIKPGFPIP
jgi:protein involved in polysaccharide export with SLBB domain